MSAAPLSCGLSTSKPLDHEDPITHYCITRRDFGIGLQAANLIHAAGESSPGGLPEHVHAVALTTPNEAALRVVWERLKLNNIPHRAIIECDGNHAGQIMAIGCAPALRSTLRRYLSSLPLLR